MKKVVVDVDDILWDLNGRICQEYSIDFSNIVSFSISDNNVLSDIDKKKLVAGYIDENTFKDIEWYNGYWERLEGTREEIEEEYSEINNSW